MKLLLIMVARQPKIVSQTDAFKCCVAQLELCLVTDACLTADLGVASVILAQSHTFLEIDHEIISTVILLSSAE